MEIKGVEEFNIAGFCKCEFILANNIASISFPNDDHQVSINLKAGTSFNEIKFTRSAVDYASTEQRDESGRYYNNVVKLVNPKLTGGKAVQFKYYEERDLVFLLTDMNGQKVLIGTPEMPARMSYKLNNPAGGRNQRTITIDAPSDEEPWFVVNEVIITGGAFSDGFSDGFRT